MNNIFSVLKKLTLIVLPVFIIHLLVFQIPILNQAQQSFQYNIWTLYLLFFIFSKIGIVIVQKVSEKNFESTGATFIIILTIKMAIFYFMAKSVFVPTSENSVEKINFCLIIVVFLIIDIFLASQILNKKQEIDKTQ
jgi:cytochrome bd-type quinol oxidase subunit 2